MHRFSILPKIRLSESNSLSHSLWTTSCVSLGQPEWAAVRQLKSWCPRSTAAGAAMGRGHARAAAPELQPLHNTARFHLLPLPQGRAPLAARRRVSGCGRGCAWGIALEAVRAFQSWERRNVLRMRSLEDDENRPKYFDADSSAWNRVLHFKM